MQLKWSRNSADFKRTLYVVGGLRVNENDKKWSKGRKTTEIHKKRVNTMKYAAKIPIWGNLSLFLKKLPTL